jgi:DNA-binding transcriptional LysR family regulator
MQLMSAPERAEHDLWLGVEVRHLAALRAVADEGTFGAAALKLGYAQSAISQQIAALERYVGHRLFDRPGGSRPVQLTRAGELLLGHAESIMTRLSARSPRRATAARRSGSVPTRASRARSCR